MKRHLLSCLLALTACGSSPLMRAAESGDRTALASAVAAKEKVGSLSNREAANLASAVAARELRAAAAAEAVERVHDSAPCTRELDDALAARSATHDDGGGEAALARVEGRRLGLDDARGYLADTNSHWRAVGVRALVRTEDREVRRRALLDPAPGVRRNAARAARDAHDSADLGVLAEAAAIDSEPIVRTEAVRAIAALPGTPDGRVANALRDLWTSGDDGLREDIALAWSAPAIWSAGGREALRILVASDDGPGAIEAAAAILRRRDVEGEMAESAIARLASGIERGALHTRLQALAHAPLARQVLLSLVRKMSDSADLKIRVAALARLADAREPHAIESLEGLAQPGSPVAEHARLALASAGDRRVQSWVEQDLAASQPAKRLVAATALAALGVASRAAPLLADGDGRVRMRAACTILMAARRSD